MPTLSSLLSRIVRRLEQTPIIGGLVRCQAADHLLALKEFVIAIVFSTATFWLSACILMYLDANRNVNYVQLLASTVSNGELFIFAVGFLGSTLIVAFDDPKGARQFPGQIWHAVALFVLGLLCAGSFALVRLASDDELSLKLNQELLFRASLWLASIAALLRYLAIVYRKFTLRPDDLMKESERQFSDQFAQRHQGEVL